MHGRLCAAAAAMALAGGTALAETRTFFLSMDGLQEVGAAGGDADGFALGTITLNDVSGQISWSFRYGNIAAPTAMHIHGPNAPAGVNAGVFIGLGVTGGSGVLSGSFVHANLAQISQILAEPSNFYVNIHNTEFQPGAVRGQLSDIQKGNITVALQEVGSGLVAPVGMTHAGDGSGRLFVLEQAGAIRIIDRKGNLLPTPFLDLAGEVVAVSPSFDERGLLGLAFHPDYESNGRFFVRYSRARAGAPGEPCFGTSRGCHEEVLAEFTVSADPNLANPTGTILFRVDEPQFNHNSGGVAFGPDGYLYFTLGDGGGAHDGLTDMPPSHGPDGNGQNIETALGSILRIDVNGAPGTYSAPADNPFVGGPGLDEIYAYGMRNPYRFSFDDGPGGDGRLFVADVGQALFEEINVVVNGGNYGWVLREGFHCFDPAAPSVPPLTCATTGLHGEPLLDPVAAYTHGDGLAVVGGYVYRGSRFDGLVGKYVFADWSTGFGAPDGRLFWLDADAADLSVIREFRLGSDDAPLGRYVLGIGEDEEGEIYVLTSTTGGPTSPGGEVARIVHPCGCEADGDAAQVDVFDLLAYLDDWFAGSFYADRDGASGVDVFDLLSFLDCWFPASAGGACP